MTTIVKRYPTFILEMKTENSSYILEYDTDKQLKESDLEEALISFSTKNSMEDDSPVFSLVILAKEKWDKILGANDFIRLQAIPDRTKTKPKNPYIMVGLISDIHKEGEYSDGILLYRITGRAMTKALMDFNVGVIQEVATVIPDIGWLPDGEEKGLNFSGNSAAGIADELMNRFVYEHAQYNFNGEFTLPDVLEHSFTSWLDDEQLADVTPFVNYQGSIRQFLEDISAKPFNELYFEFTEDGKCAAIMRRTPFDPSDWDQLPLYKFTSDIVVEESFGKTDAEMFSVYVVQPANIMEFSSIDLGVFPKFHPDLIKKYGYKRLDAENRYLLTAHLADAAEETATGEGGQLPPPEYEDLLAFIVENGMQDPEILRTQENTVYSTLIENFPTLSESLAESIISMLKDRDFNKQDYNTAALSSGSSSSDEINQEKSVAGAKLERFTQRLYNWYCENANFYSGDIRIIGNPIYRIGARVQYEDFEQETIWEFYVESVQHEFSFTNGYTTILGVTRGLPERGRARYTNLWGKSEEFKGGYFGEPTLENLLEEAQTPTGPGNNWNLGGGGAVASAALDTARRISNGSSIYVFGGGRNGTNPFLSTPVKVDCSSFVWWCYYENGVSLKGGKTGMTTDTIKTDSKLVTVSAKGSSKETAKSLLKQGDLVYFDTYKADGHLGIYAGGGKFIGAQSSTGVAAANMDSGYWWQKFNGRVLRYNG